MDRRRHLRTIALVYVLASSLFGQTARSGDIPATAVTGESWLRHLHRSFNETSMGKTGRLGPPDSGGIGVATTMTVAATPAPSARASARDSDRISERTSDPIVTLRGEDLYRLNCRGCHGESGQGAPPEINSVINPVRASSPAAVAERMKTVGMAMSRAEIAKLAEQSRDALLQRFHHGGQDMPAFPHLSETEIGALMAYLKQLADVPDAPGVQIAVRTTPIRVGEHIVKSTCHICHGADGPNPTPQQILDGEIPPLSALTSRVSREQFVRKVTRGAPVVMGTLRMTYRGRMPVFYYLSEEEAEDAYRYLADVGVEGSGGGSIGDSGVAASSPAGFPGDGDPPVWSEARAAKTERVSIQKQMEGNDSQSLALLAVVGVLVSLLLAGGVALTLRECMRLSGGNDSRAAARELPGGRRALAAEETGDRLIA